jgi:hypothetical protein
MASSRATRALLRTVDRLVLTEGVRVLSGRFPTSLQHRLAALRMKLRARTGEVSEFPVPPEALRQTYRDGLSLLVERNGHESVGDYLEFGVFVGTSMSCMHDALVQEGLDHVRMFGFDSFEGLPGDAASDDTQAFNPGQFRAPLEAARANLMAKGVDLDRVELVKGWFDDSLSPELILRHDIHKASVIMVDCDLYSSTKTALDFCAPLIKGEAVILFDDWWPATLGVRNVGERRAFEEFLAAHPGLSATELESYQPEAAKVFLLTQQETDEPRRIGPTWRLS